jgi:hypothetical protein
MSLSFVYTSNKRIKCFFFIVVVRNESLVKYYPGSFKGFMEKYYPLCNLDISVRVYMNAADWFDLMEDLIGNGLKMGEDFCRFDTDYLIDSMYSHSNGRKNLDFGVDWLRGRCVDWDVYVWLTDDHQGQAGL